jgi:hypothetical protein
MSRQIRLIRLIRFIAGIGTIVLMLPIMAAAQREAVPRSSDQRTAEPRRPGDGQRRAEPRRPAPQRPAPRRDVAVRGEVIFIGGYYYDPFYAPYPWWPRPTYHYRYYPIYDYRAEVRVMATPRDASVYVDGFYAGVVDDFDGMFQRLLLPPGGHTFVLYRPGFRTLQLNLYLQPGSTMRVHEALEPLPSGYASEPPPVAPAVPPPPSGSYRMPRTPAPEPVPPPPPDASQAIGFGTLDLRVQPPDAEVSIDGQTWRTSEPGRFVIDVADGRHHVEVTKRGYVRYSTDIDVREGRTTPINVSLPADKR